MSVATLQAQPPSLTRVTPVDRDMLIWDTPDMADDSVTRARAALDRAERALERRREELAEAIAEAVRGGEKLSKVAVRAKYTREHVRRIARAAGIEPTVDREPPERPR